MTDDTSAAPAPKVGARVQLYGTVTELFPLSDGRAIVNIEVDSGQTNPGTPTMTAPLAGAISWAGNPARYLSTADIARHFGVTAATVQTWRHPNRYGPGRTAEQIAKAPTCPQPDVQVGESKSTAGWLPSRLGEWDEWRKSLPGQGHRD